MTAQSLAEEIAARIASRLTIEADRIEDEADELAEQLADIPTAVDLTATERDICEEIAHLEARLAKVRAAQRARVELETSLSDTRQTAAELKELAARHQRDHAEPPVAVDANGRMRPAPAAAGHPYRSFAGTTPRGPAGRVVPPPGPVEVVGGEMPPDPVVAVHGPLMTMPDTGLAPPPLSPAPSGGRARHEKPRDSTGTGGFRRIAERAGLVTPSTTDQDGDA